MSKAQFLKDDLNPGEHYAGLIRGKEGKPDYHLILVPGEPQKRLTWDAAKLWAAKIGDLPTRREQSLLFINLKEQFKPEWYWSGEQHASLSNYAWGQIFDYGSQYNLNKRCEGRARAVRRLEIQ